MVSNAIDQNTRGQSMPGQLLSDLLDRGYTQATRDVIGAISNAPENGILARRLRDFDEAARRAAEFGERLSPDDPVVRALLADFGDVLVSHATLLNQAAPVVQDLGINASGQFFRQTALPGFSDEEAARIGVRFNQPDPEAINAAVQFTQSAAWNDMMAQYVEGNEAQIRQLILRGLVGGVNPLQVSEDLQLAMGSIPAFRANALLQTLQLESARVGIAVHQTANADILEDQVRIATLDGRTCIACWAEHGKVLPVGALIIDHHQGRCIGIARVRGYPLEIETGPDRFDRLLREEGNGTINDGDAQVLEMMRRRMPGAMDALRVGDVQLADFVQPYQDTVFGDMQRQASLRYALSRPDRRIPTVNGYTQADVGAPGETIESMREFLNNSQGPLAQALTDWDNSLMGWSPEGTIINRDGTYQAALRFVRESQDIQYGRDYLLEIVRQQAQENGVSVNLDGAARLLNQHYRYQAQAIQTAAQIGRVRLTEAQIRRLAMAINGNYLDMVYTTDTSVAGSLANQTRRVRRGGGLTEVELITARENFNRHVRDDRQFR